MEVYPRPKKMNSSHHIMPFIYFILLFQHFILNFTTTAGNMYVFF